MGTRNKKRVHPLLDKLLLFGFVVGTIVYFLFFFITTSRNSVSENYKLDIGINIITFFSFIPFIIICYLFLKRFSHVRKLDDVSSVNIGIRIPFVVILTKFITNPKIARILAFCITLIFILSLYYIAARGTGFNLINQLKDLSEKPYTFEGKVEEKITKEKRLYRTNKINTYFIVIDYVEFQIEQSVYFDVEKGDYIKILYLPNSQLIVGDVDIQKQGVLHEENEENETQDLLDEFLSNPEIDQEKYNYVINLEDVIFRSCQNTTCIVEYEDGTGEEFDIGR